MKRIYHSQALEKPEVLLFRSAMPDSRSILEQELHSLGLVPRVVFSADGYQVK
ncbi:MAG: hypothetical protein V7L25_07605 [Nostoc sp.]|uniref:hypothetical protein n=1 Tax=Nostoc sp. TaxID=1180 RepID=UPI002FF41DCF